MNTVRWKHITLDRHRLRVIASYDRANNEVESYESNPRNLGTWTCTLVLYFLTRDLAQREHDGDLQQTPDGDELAKVGAGLLDEEVVEHGEEAREEGEEAADVEADLGHRPRVPVLAGGLPVVAAVDRQVGGSVGINCCMMKRTLTK